MITTRPRRSIVVNLDGASRVLAAGKRVAEDMATGFIKRRVVEAGKKYIDKGIQYVKKGVQKSSQTKKQGKSPIGVRGYIRKKAYRKARAYSRKTIRRKRRAISLRTCAKLGSAKTYRISGTVSSATAIHLGYASLAKKQMLNGVAMAIVRLVLRECITYDIHGQQEAIKLESSSTGGTGLNQEGKYQLSLLMYNRDGTNVTHDVDIEDGDGIQTVADNLAAKLYDLSAANSTNTAMTDYSTFVLHEIMLTEIISLDVNNVQKTIIRVRGRIDANNMKVHYTSNAVMKWQNATNTAGTGISNDGDVNAMPLIGTELAFNKSRPDPVNPQHVVHFDYVLDWPIVKAVAMNNDLSNMLEKKDFKNCRSEKDFAINPGNICIHGLNQSGSKTLQEFLKWLKSYHFGGDSPGTLSGGKFYMWSLKKPIETDAVMNVNYTVDYSTGVYVTHKKRLANFTSFQSSTF